MKGFIVLPIILYTELNFQPFNNYILTTIFYEKKTFTPSPLGSIAALKRLFLMFILSNFMLSGCENATDVFSPEASELSTK